jgi:hypothetical protein
VKARAAIVPIALHLLCTIALLAGPLQLPPFPPKGTSRAPNATLPPGIALLPGYQHERYQTYDTIYGRIWSDRLDIRYAWGFGNPNRVDTEAANLLWSREQVVDRYRVQTAMTRNRTLLVTFSAAGPGGPVGQLPGGGQPTNFYAAIDSDEDVADMLLMVLAFRGARP